MKAPQRIWISSFCYYAYLYAISLPQESKGSLNQDMELHLRPISLAIASSPPNGCYPNSKSEMRLSCCGAFININNRTKTQQDHHHPFKQPTPATKDNTHSSFHRSKNDLKVLGINSVLTLPSLTFPWLNQKGKNKKQYNYFPDEIHSTKDTEVQLPVKDKSGTLTNKVLSSLFQGGMVVFPFQSDLVQHAVAKIMDRNNNDIRVQTENNHQHNQADQIIHCTSSLYSTTNTANIGVVDLENDTGGVYIESDDGDIPAPPKDQKTLQTDDTNQHKLTHIMHNDNDFVQEGAKNNTTKTVTLLHKYHHPPTNTTLYGLGISLPKFKRWVTYYMSQRQNAIYQTNPAKNMFGINSDKRQALIVNDDSYSKEKESCNQSRNSNSNAHKKISKFITTEEIEIHSERRNELRREWYARRLISDRTEVLASYPSNQINVSIHDISKNLARNECNEQDIENKERKKKRGGFNDLLQVYAERLIAMLTDELIETRNINQAASIAIGEASKTNILDVEDRIPDESKSFGTNFKLLSWLHSEYGTKETDQLLFSNFSTLNEKDKMKELQKFLNWFRDHFPYYYDRCDTCHASYRDDEANNSQNEIIKNDQVHDEDDTCEDDTDDGTDGTFLGYVFPTPEEMKGKASRTEIYHCHKCSYYTRFPRYNSIPAIVQFSRGRCGEYSILLYRILRDLGHETRWVVDWSDHVWVECWVTSDTPKQGRWIHLDPCEAACDEPLLYQKWGKKQTMIIAFWLPPCSNNVSQQLPSLEFKHYPLIEDVTLTYTSDTMKIIQSRREDSHDKIQTSIREVEALLVKAFNDLTSL